MSTLYPTGYGSHRITLDELKAKYSKHLHPEMSRRLWPWIESKHGVIGIGSGWRTKPHPVSAASRNGRSFHQSQAYKSGEFYTAFDLVQYNPGGNHIAPRWSEVPKQGSAESRALGVHMNIGHESWHIQPIELDGFSLWESQGRPDLFANYPIPGVPVPPSPLPPFRPEQGEFSLWPLNENKPRLAVKAFVTERVEKGFDNWTYRGEAVRYLQGVILHKGGGNITVDGWYGPASERRVIETQNWLNAHGGNTTVDGLVGPAMWGWFDFLAGM